MQDRLGASSCSDNLLARRSERPIRQRQKHFFEYPLDVRDQGAVLPPRRNLRTEAYTRSRNVFPGSRSWRNEVSKRLRKRDGDAGRRGGIDQLIPPGYTKVPLTHPYCGAATCMRHGSACLLRAGPYRNRQYNFLAN